MTDVNIGDLQAAMAEPRQLRPELARPTWPRFLRRSSPSCTTTTSTASSKSEHRPWSTGRLLTLVQKRTEVTPWFENAADLLTEPHPGDHPFLVQDLVVDRSVAQLVGPPKKGKTYVLLDLAVAVATGGAAALSRFAVPDPRPVLLVLEESGRAVAAGSTCSPADGRSGPTPSPSSTTARTAASSSTAKSGATASRATCQAQPWRLIAFDPYARLKGGSDEDSQKESGPVLDFLRELRDLANATVLYVARPRRHPTARLR